MFRRETKISTAMVTRYGSMLKRYVSRRPRPGMMRYTQNSRPNR